MRPGPFPWPMVFLALLAGACGGATSPAPAPEPAPREPTTSPAPTRVELELGEGVTVMDPACDSELEERCNAVDDDCDGQLDEGCGATPDGALKIAVQWNTKADLALTIEGPGGTQIEHGGDGCDAEPRRRASAVLESPGAGSYAVALHYGDECGEDTGPTTATIAIAHRDRLAGVLNRTLSPGERALLARVSLAPAAP